MTAEFKILGWLALALLAMEAGARVFESKLSKDVAHVRSLAGLPAQLAPGKGGILVMGNSLARCGVDGAGLSAARPGGPEVAFMVPDASAAIEWAWGYRRHVLRAGARPDLVILLTGRTHLLDPAVVQIPRLGAHHVAGGDRLTFMREELAGFDDRAEFVVASVSRLFANRGRVQQLAFYGAVPGYETSVNRINIAAGGGFTASRETGEPDRGLRNCARLIDSVRESGAKLVVVTSPLPEPWNLPESVAGLLREKSVPVIPLGAELRLPAERFPDGYHLDPEGAEMATKVLAERLSQMGL